MNLYDPRKVLKIDLKYGMKVCCYDTSDTTAYNTCIHVIKCRYSAQKHQSLKRSFSVIWYYLNVKQLNTLIFEVQVNRHIIFTITRFTQMVFSVSKCWYKLLLTILEIDKNIIAFKLLHVLLKQTHPCLYIYDISTCVNSSSWGPLLSILTTRTFAVCHGYATISNHIYGT